MDEEDRVTKALRLGIELVGVTLGVALVLAILMVTPPHKLIGLALIVLGGVMTVVGWRGMRWALKGELVIIRRLRERWRARKV